MLFLLSAVLPLQNLHDLAHIGGEAVGQRRQRPDDDIGLRQLQRSGECAEERIRTVGNPGGDLCRISVRFWPPGPAAGH